MQFRKHLELERGQKEINITPLVDMVFLLLIFFMLTSSFIVTPGIKVNLPKAVSAEAVKEENFNVTVNNDNLIYVEGSPVTRRELSERLEKMIREDRQQPVLIKADKEVRLGSVVEVWDICRKAGISQVNIATQQDTQ